LSKNNYVEKVTKTVMSLLTEIQSQIREVKNQGGMNKQPLQAINCRSSCDDGDDLGTELPVNVRQITN